MELSTILKESKEKIDKLFKNESHDDTVIENKIYESKSKLTGYTVDPHSTPSPENTENLIKTINKIYQ